MEAPHVVDELDAIEYQLGQDLYSRAWSKTYGPLATLGLTVPPHGSTHRQAASFLHCYYIAKVRS